MRIERTGIGKTNMRYLTAALAKGRLAKQTMSLMEKIIYLADMIEPNRKPFPGLDALRRTCRTDLDEAMKLGLSMSVGHVRAQGKLVHPDTQRAIDAYADSKQTKREGKQ